LRRSASHLLASWHRWGHAASTPIGDPYYVYYLYEHRQTGVGSFELQLGDSGVQSGGVLLERHELGTSSLGFPADDMVSGYNDTESQFARLYEYFGSRSRSI
jgi:hypothetical protein